jgi:hypothetical protein
MGVVEALPDNVSRMAMSSLKCVLEMKARWCCIVGRTGPIENMSSIDAVVIYARCVTDESVFHLRVRKLRMRTEE